jgi:DNA modification methylase
MNNRFVLYNKSCIDAMRDMELKSVDLVLTDPPYNLGLFMKNRATNLKAMRENFFGAAGWDDLKFSDWEKEMDLFFAELSRVVKESSSVIIFMSIIKVETIIRLAEKHGFYYKTTGIWHKKNPMPRNMNLHFINSTEAWIYFTYKKHTGTFNNEGKAIHDFFETSITPSGEKKYGKHPTQKPIQLLDTFVRILTNENDTVFDPFCGSGSSGVAALLNGRKFIGSEISEEYCRITENRIAQVLSHENI